jgi:outer membrane cobalamin receptor
MRLALRPAPLALFVLFVSSAAHAGPVTGTIVDPDGRPVRGATVLVVAGGTVLATAASGSSGAFHVQAPDRESLELRVAVEGFRAEPVSLLRTASPQEVGRIVLSVSSFAESVVVSAAQVEVPLSTASSSVTIVQRDELQARQVESLADALRSVPGLTVAATGGRGAVTGVFPRGGESDYSLVVIDGVQANAFGGAFDFAHVPVVNVERIEIVRGPQSALHGSNAIGSVIRVVTRRGGPPEGELTVESGSFGTLLASAAGAGAVGAWAWRGSAEGETGDGAEGESTPSGEAVTNDDYTRHTLAVGGGWTHTRGSAIGGDLRYSENERGFPGPFGSDPGGTFAGIDTISRGGDARWLASLSTTHPLTGRARLQAQVSHAQLDSAFRSPSFDPSAPPLDSESWSRRIAGRVQADLTFIEALDSSFGAELQRERAGGTFIVAGDAREVPVERTLAGVFGEMRWNHRARVFVTGGVRAEFITRDALAGNRDAFSPRPAFDDEMVTSINPKVAVAWFLRASGGDFTKIRASGGTGIRPPDVFEIAFTDNPSLKPERSRSFDVGFDQTWLGGRVAMEAAAFANRYDDLIVAVGSFSTASRFRTDNISNARTQGLELAGSARARRSGVDLRVRVAYTLLDTEIMAVDRGTGAPSPFTPGDPLLRRPRHQFGADVLVSTRRVAAFVEGNGRGRFRDVDPSFGTFGGVFDAPGFFTWTAGLSYRVLRQVEILGRVTNLFDRTYEEALGFPSPGRGFYAGVRLAARP